MRKVSLPMGLKQRMSSGSAVRQSPHLILSGVKRCSKLPPTIKKLKWTEKSSSISLFFASVGHDSHAHTKAPTAVPLAASLSSVEQTSLLVMADSGSRFRTH